jgi:hypothetical protein
LDIANVNLNLIPIYKTEVKKSPNLEQIIKPETDTLSKNLMNPRPHPPISREQIINSKFFLRNRSDSHYPPT